MATLAADLLALRELTPRQRVLRRLARRRGAMLGLGVVVFFVVLAVLAPTIAPHDPLQTSWSEVRKAPSAAHLFGTDEIGRDVTSRVIWGARASLLAGLVSVCISLSLGVPIGLLAGYVGGWVDALISRITDAMLACPFLILAIALAAFLDRYLRTPRQGITSIKLAADEESMGLLQSLGAASLTPHAAHGADTPFRGGGGTGGGGGASGSY